MFQALGAPATPAMQAARAFVRAATWRNTAHLSRLIRVWAAAGEAVTALVTVLLTQQHPDGAAGAFQRIACVHMHPPVRYDCGGFASH